MVGMFSRFSAYMSKPPEPSLLRLGKKLDLVSEEEDEDGGDAHGDLAREKEDDDGEERLDVDAGGDEFKPIKHPLEPPDDDRPAKFPLQFSSVEEGELIEPFAVSPLKIAGPTVGDGGRVAKQTHTPSHRKRQQAPSHSHPQSNYNIFQVFDQCKLEECLMYRQTSLND